MGNCTSVETTEAHISSLPENPDDTDKRSELNGKDEVGKLLLIPAIRDGHCERVKELLAAGADVNRIEYYQHTEVTPLTAAAETGCSVCLQEILKAGADVNFIRRNGAIQETALIIAAQIGDRENVQELILAGADVNLKTAKGASAVTKAADNGHSECVEVLLASGASVKGYQIKAARIKNCPEMTAQLLKAGGNACEALKWSIWNSKHENLDILIKASIDVNMRLSISATETYTSLGLAVTYSDDQCIDSLVEAGADVNDLGRTGTTLLMAAVEKQKDRIIKLLMQRGADVNVSDTCGRSPLMVAARMGFANYIPILLQQGAHVNKVAVDGYTALMEAVGNGHANCAQLLVESGADVNIKSMRNETALSQAVLKGNAECIELLVDAGADVNIHIREHTSVLLFAASKGFDNLLEKLIEAGADVNKTTSNGVSALMKAAEIGHSWCIRTLIFAGADVNLPNPFLRRNSPLVSVLKYMARYNKDLEITIRSLVRAGANVNTTVTETGKSVLDLAADLHNEAIRKRSSISTELYNCVKVLILAGAKMKAKNFNECFQLRNQLKLNLQNLSREAIRKRILVTHPKSNLTVLVVLWKLPKCIQEQLLLEDIVNLY